jgi:MoaA/NifB/PqqE/SkfB family radical SAM enzyme
MHDNFCYHPWVSVDVTPQGEFRPCCKHSGSCSPSLEDYKNNPEILQLKNDLLAGNKPAACKRCWNDEDSGLLSKRQIDNQEIFYNKITNLDSYKILSITFGNSCNLTCRTCTSYFSSGWIVPEKKLKSKFPAIEIFNHRKFYQDQKFIDLILKSFDDVIQIDFAGGETFISGTSEHLKFLQHFVQRGAGDISLRYVTNATVFPNEKFWDLWKNFKSLEIQLSVDGTNKHFEYLRHPAQWQQVLDNINLYKQKEIDKLTVSHTVSNLNVFFIPEFIIWCIKNKLGKPNFNLVEAPIHYNIRSLPGSIKQAVARKLAKYNLQNIVDYMYLEDLSDHFSQFVDFTKELDLQRQESFTETFPDYSDLFTDYF